MLPAKYLGLDSIAEPMKKNLNCYLKNLSPERQKIVDKSAAEILVEETIDCVKMPPAEINHFQLDDVDTKGLPSY